MRSIFRRHLDRRCETIKGDNFAGYYISYVLPTCAHESIPTYKVIARDEGILANLKSKFLAHLVGFSIVPACALFYCMRTYTYHYCLNFIY